MSEFCHLYQDELMAAILLSQKYVLLCYPILILFLSFFILLLHRAFEPSLIALSNGLGIATSPAFLSRSLASLFLRPPWSLALFSTLPTSAPRSQRC